MASTPYRNAPSALSGKIAIVAGSDTLERALASAIEVLGGFVRTVAPDGADLAGADIVVWTGPPDDAGVVDRLLATAARGDVRLIVAVAADAVDAWSFAVGVVGVTLVAAGDHDGLIRALASRRLRGTSTVREGGRDDPVGRLRDLGLELSSIARALENLADAPSVADRRLDYRGEPVDGPPVSAAMIRATIRARRMRDQFFTGELFADPAWDILLDLMAARLERRDVAVSSLCIAAAVPPTTALRWISAMTEQGMLVRVADADDRRRAFIQLSPGTADAMAACLAAMLRAVPPVA